jgi:hypothetical protein
VAALPPRALRHLERSARQTNISGDEVARFCRSATFCARRRGANLRHGMAEHHASATRCERWQRGGARQRSRVMPSAE